MAALRADESAPDADLYRRIASNSSTESNQNKCHLYRFAGINAEGQGHAQGQGPGAADAGDIHNTVHHDNSIPLPPYLTNIIKETKLSSLMGMLPQGNMVWVSVDDALYIWEYGSLNGGRKKEDFVCFQVPSGQCVVSVGIVRPKPGVFKDIVEWCLVVTTPEEAIICALAREANDTNAISYNQSYNSDDSHLVLIPTRYEIPTDSVPLLSICGTDDGRIFIGGYDGCLYEMSYEAHLDKNQYTGRFFSDHDDFGHDYGYDGYGASFNTASITSTIATTGKRALSTLLFGPTSPSEMRSRKCRKVNHSSFAPPVVSAFVPGFILKASSAVFGSSPTLQGGPIVNLTLDHDRKTMYALTAKGYIHAFDLDTSAKSKGSYGNGVMNNPPKWACSVNVTKSVRRYLDSVSHGRMYPPSNMGTDSALAAINFPGGGSGAQAGVGGMDGARSILKTADAEVMKRKSKATSRRTTNGMSKSRMRPVAEGCLHPISIHIVPASESKFLTLVAISSGGLRYYLSVLPDAGTSYGNISVRPGRRFTLCHIRAPPPFTVGNDHDVSFDETLTKEIGTLPRMKNRGGDFKGRATKGCYVSGTTMLAIDCDNPAKDEDAGDSILSITPDYTQQKKNANTANSSQAGQAIVPYSNTSNGVNESVSLPMVANKISSVGASILPGGHVWELNAKTLSTSEGNSVLRLFTRSTTPSSMGQSGKLPPAYLPPSTKRRGLNRYANANVNMHPKTPLDTATATSRALVTSSGGLTGFLKTILSGKNGVVSRPPSLPQRQLNAYRISERFGCNKLGFSIPAQTKNTIGRRSSSALQASMLPPAALNPAPAPLSEMAMQHLVTNTKSGGILALNSGGIHYFTQSSPIKKLQILLTHSNVSNMGRDEKVKMFFKSYSYSESCAMCLSIAVIAESNNIVARKAIQAAMSYAHRPALVRTLDGTSRVSTSSESMGIQSNKLAGFEGYNFTPSFLYNGLISLVSRLLRPVWCKAAVVVTAGRTIPPRKKGGISEQLPAKVELLLDHKTLEEVRRPLAALQTLMQEIFGPAVKNIPGAHQGDTEMKDMTAGQGMPSSNLISQSLQYQNQARFQNNSRDQQPTEKELSTAACQSEERNIHAMYRLVSRSVQLLTLVDHLHRAHFTPTLPDVEFGLIHGLTFSQLVTLKGAQDRIEVMLTNLFSGSSLLPDQQDIAVASSVESDNLCSLLSQQCYMYFSIGSRLTFLGFRNAEVALSTSSMSKQNEHALAASNYLREASRHWHNASHVTGQLLDMSKVPPTNVQNAYSGYNELALRAIENASPLARAICVLMEVNDVAAVVDVCLTCARNFDKHIITASNDLSMSEELFSGSMMPWERTLYHRHLHESSFDNNAGVGTTNPLSTSDDEVKRTCYALLYFHLERLLESVAQYPQDNTLVERMLSIATSSSDISFIHGLYEYLASSGHVDTLLRIDSSTLETWLQANSNDCHLLWRYYTVHNIHWMAGEVVWNRAITTDHKVSLEERVECLTRAIGSYSVALRELNNEKALLQRRIASGNSASNDSLFQRYVDSPSHDELNRAVSQISEQIDVAKIQTRLLSTILSSSNAKNIDEDQISEIKTSLVDISKIYNEFAAPLGLYDICLAILQTCKHDDSSTITKLWKSILCEELLPCRTTSKKVQEFLANLQRDSMLEEEDVVLSSTSVTKENGEPLMSFEDGDWITNIKARVLDLGKELHGKDTDFVFPLHFVAECLEGLNRAFNESTHTKSEHWPIKVLAESGASFFTILDAYHTIFSNQSDSSNASLKLQELFNIGEVLKLWISACISGVSNLTSISISDTDSSRRQLDRYSSNILSELDNYKAELESLVGCNTDAVGRCYALFNEIERSLRRRSW